MKQFLPWQCHDPYETELVMDALEGMGSRAQTSQDTSVTHWWSQWTSHSPERLECVLFLAALRSHLKRADCADDEWVDIPTLSMPAASSDGAISAGASKPGTRDPAASFDWTVHRGPEQTLQLFLTLLDEACKRVPEQDPKFWRSEYQRRPGEFDLIRRFLQDSRATLCCVSGAQGSGKSTFLKEKVLSSNRLPRQPADGGQGAALMDFFYLDVASLEPVLEHVYRETVCQYSNAGLLRQDTEDTIRDILFRRIEAQLERQVVLQIQSRFVEYFGTQLTGKSGAPTANHLSLQLPRGGEYVARNSEFLDHWVPCYVVAAVIAAAPWATQHRRYNTDHYKLVDDVEELQSALVKLALRVERGGHKTLQVMLEHHDIGSNDGILWRAVYSAWFGRGQPVLIMDSIDSFTAPYLREPTLRAALSVALTPPGPRLRLAGAWKTLIAVRDLQLVNVELSDVPRDRFTSIALTTTAAVAGDAHNLRLAPEQLDAIVKSRFEYAFEAAQRPSWLWPQLDVLLGQMTFPPDATAHEGCETISARLDWARGFATKALTYWFEVQSKAVDSDSTEVTTVLRAAVVERNRSVLSSSIRHQSRDYMVQTSETRLLEVACWGAATERHVARQLIHDQTLYDQWREELCILTERVAGEQSGYARAVELRRACLQLIRRKALFDHLREHRITGADQREILRAVLGRSDYENSVIDEHRNYLRAIGSSICVAYVGSWLFKDAAFLSSKFAEYEAAYRSYFGIYVMGACGGAGNFNSQCLVAKRHVENLKWLILRMPSAADNQNELAAHAWQRAEDPTTEERGSGSPHTNGSMEDVPKTGFGDRLSFGKRRQKSKRGLSLGSRASAHSRRTNRAR